MSAAEIDRPVIWGIILIGAFGVVAAGWLLVRTISSIRGNRSGVRLQWLLPIVPTAIACICTAMALEGATVLIGDLVESMSSWGRLPRDAVSGVNSLGITLGITNGVLGAAIAVTAGLSVLVESRDRTGPSSVVPAAVAGLTVVGAAAATAWLQTAELGGWPYLVPAALLVGGLGCVMASTAGEPTSEADVVDAVDGIRAGFGTIIAVIFATVAALGMHLKPDRFVLLAREHVEIPPTGLEGAMPLVYAGLTATIAAGAATAVVMHSAGRPLSRSTIRRQLLAWSTTLLSILVAFGLTYLEILDFAALLVELA